MIEPSLSDGARPKFEHGRYNISSNLRVRGFQTIGAIGLLVAQAYRKGASVLVVGVFGSEVMITVGLIQDWELHLLGSLMYVGDDYREAIRLLNIGAVQTHSIITHRFTLTEAIHAFETTLQRGTSLKVILTNP